MVKTNGDFWKKAGAVLLVCFLIAYLILAMLLPSGPYGESGSALLAAVSLSNHGSFSITQDDVDEACILFPEDAEWLRWYYTVMFDALDGGRYPWYVGIYAPLCIPMLSVLRLLHLDAVYAFSLTNALMLSTALWVVYRFAKISAKQKLLAILLLGTSPIIRYINLQLYETVLFSFVVMAMVFWLNRWRKLAALFLSIGGTINPTIMAFGFFMIIDYFLEMLMDSKWSVKSFFRRFSENWRKTACLAACFLPCFVPFVITRVGMGIWYIHAGFGTFQGLGGRFSAYLFDLNLGLFPYFPVLMFLFAVVTIWGGVHRRYDMLLTFFGCLAVIGAYSLNYHINCGMVGIARFNVWLFPIIALGTVYYMDVSFAGVRARRLCYGLTALSCVWCVFIVGATACSTYGDNYLWWSPAAETVLKYAPELYDPLPSTFYSRTLHIDGAYDITDPAYYLDPQTDEVRKLIYKADDGQAEKVLNLLKGDEGSVTYLKEKLEDNGVDGKYHYIDFPASGAYQLVEKTPEDLCELADVAIVAEGHDLMLESDGNCLITLLPFTIKENTTYKIELEFEKNCVLPDSGDLYVDFYGGPSYDNFEQQAGWFVRDGKYSYTFYFDSGTIDGASVDGLVRVISVNMDLPLKVELLRVTETERLN